MWNTPDTARHEAGETKTSPAAHACEGGAAQSGSYGGVSMLTFGRRTLTMEKLRCT